MNEANSGWRGLSYMRRVLIALGLATAILVVLFIFWRIVQALLVLFAACLVGVFLSGCGRWLQQKTRLGYGWCVMITASAIVAAFVAAGAFLGVRVWLQADELYQSLAQTAQDGLDWIRQAHWGQQLLEEMEDNGLQIGEWLLPAGQVVMGGVGAIGMALLIAVIGLYLAADPELYTSAVLRLVPVGRRPRAREVLDAVGHALAGWLFAQVISMAIIGTLVAGGLWLFGIELWLILGLLAGLLTFIPNLGPIIAGVPPVLLALNQSVVLAAGVVAYFTAVQMVEGYVVTPLVQQRVIRLPPAGILATQLLMGWALGMLGVALAAPLLALMMVVVEMVYVQDLLGDHDLKITGQ